jgi:hypothetical protein
LRNLELSDFRILVDDLAQKFKSDGIVPNQPRAEREAGKEDVSVGPPIDLKLLREKYLNK